MFGQSLCMPLVSKHSRISLSSPFPVCASVDFVHQSSDTIIVTYSLNIAHTEKVIKHVTGRQNVNWCFGEVLLIALAA